MARMDDIRNFAIQRTADNHGKGLSRQVAERFGVSRSYANRLLRALVHDGVFVAAGSTRARTYSLVQTVRGRWSFELEALEENAVWRSTVAPELEGIRENVSLICQIGLTEMVNNAVDHSEGTSCEVSLSETAGEILLEVRDDGVGIFRKLTERFDLEDERHAALELAKGKLTTDPDSHSGEGVFFTSRMFDAFCIDSGSYSYLHSSGNREWVFEETDPKVGTHVQMRIRHDSCRTAQRVYDQHAGPEDYGFNVTHIPVSLSIYPRENLVSRSQAKRLLARVSRFSRVVLDFEGLDMIGQAFADEVFRVFALQHPEIELRPTRASRRVSAMIERAVAARQAGRIADLP